MSPLSRREKRTFPRLELRSCLPNYLDDGRHAKASILGFINSDLKWFSCEESTNLEQFIPDAELLLPFARPIQNDLERDEPRDLPSLEVCHLLRGRAGQFFVLTKVQWTRSASLDIHRVETRDLQAQLSLPKMLGCFMGDRIELVYSNVASWGLQLDRGRFMVVESIEGKDGGPDDIRVFEKTEL